MADSRLRLENADRISSLATEVILHILSFLPSTKEAARTGILSKSWVNVWTGISKLSFQSSRVNDENFAESIERALILHSGDKLEKFSIQYDEDQQYVATRLLTPVLRFLKKKKVKDVNLHLYSADGNEAYVLPNFFLINDSVKKLRLFKCRINHLLPINWSALVNLSLDCSFLVCESIERVLLGCPSLLALELIYFDIEDYDVINCPQLRKLKFVDTSFAEEDDCPNFEINCPNLEEFILTKLDFSAGRPREALFPPETLRQVLSKCIFLRFLELRYLGYEEIEIFSDSVRKVVLGESIEACEFEIKCPMLEELYMHNVDTDCPMELHLPATASVTLDYVPRNRHLAKDTLDKLKHVGLLHIGDGFTSVLMEKESGPGVEEGAAGEDEGGETAAQESGEAEQ